MSMTDISHVTHVEVLAAAARAADMAMAPNGAPVKAAAGREGTSAMAAIDTLGYNSVLFVATGAGAGALTLSVKHGDTATDLEDALEDCLIHEASDSTATTQKLGYIGGRRYVQLVGATAGVVIMQRPNVMPV